MSMLQAFEPIQRIWGQFQLTEEEPLRVDHSWLDAAKQKSLIPASDRYAWAKSDLAEELVANGTHEIVWLTDKKKSIKQRVVDPSGMILLRKFADSTGL